MVLLLGQLCSRSMKRHVSGRLASLLCRLDGRPFLSVASCIEFLIASWMDRSSESWCFPMALRVSRTDR